MMADDADELVVRQFVVSEHKSEADALAAEILTMTHPVYAQEIQRNWRLPLHEFPAPSTITKETRYETGAAIRALFEDVLERIVAGNPLEAPSVWERPDLTQLMFPRGITPTPLFKHAEVLLAPGRFVAEANDEWASEQLARDAAASECYAISANNPSDPDSAYEIQRVRKLARGGDDALANLAHLASVV